MTRAAFAIFPRSCRTSRAKPSPTRASPGSAGPTDDTMIPKASTKLDYEIEIAIVIGARGRYLAKKNALDVVAGYCICNDVSERAFQTERGGQWTKGKGCETFGPLGPWLVTKDEVPNVTKH